MTKKDRTNTDTRGELIAKILLAYKQLPKNRRDAIASVIRDRAASQMRKG